LAIGKQKFSRFDAGMQPLFSASQFWCSVCRNWKPGPEMESEKQIAEAVCDVAEELARRELLPRGHGGFKATQTGEGRMEGFNETDAANLQRVKDAMAERAVGGGGVLGQPDAAAAAAFAALLDAETRREELRLKSVGQGKAAAAAPDASWAESISGRQSEPVLAA
jgi:hypothetical protein